MEHDDSRVPPARSSPSSSSPRSPLPSPPWHALGLKTSVRTSSVALVLFETEIQRQGEGMGDTFIMEIVGLVIDRVRLLETPIYLPSPVKMVLMPWKVAGASSVRRGKGIKLKPCLLLLLLKQLRSADKFPAPLLCQPYKLVLVHQFCGGRDGGGQAGAASDILWSASRGRFNRVRQRQIIGIFRSLQAY